MHPYSSALLDRLGLHEGMRCLDAGCGGGDVALELARRVGPGGSVVGVDIDAAKLDIAREDASAAGVANVEFSLSELDALAGAADFDVVYARFLLTHLSEPAGAIAKLFHHLRPGGAIAVEDIDFSGSFAYPHSRAFDRYLELYCAVVRNRGGDPNIGPRLPLLLEEWGFTGVDVRVVQPAATRGEPKLLNPLTLENIAAAVLHDGLASREEIDAMVDELYLYAANPATITGLPRIVQAWGRKPG